MLIEGIDELYLLASFEGKGKGESFINRMFSTVRAIGADASSIKTMEYNESENSVRFTFHHSKATCKVGL